MFSCQKRNNGRMVQPVIGRDQATIAVIQLVFKLRGGIPYLGPCFQGGGGHGYYT